MSEPIAYRPAPVLHWFTVGSRSARARAKERGREIFQGSDIKSGLRQAAGFAAEIGRGAISELAHRSADETSFYLLDDAVEVTSLTGRRRIAYADVLEIVQLPNDRFQLVFRGGKQTVRPVAHLVAGRARVPVGWLRNGMEVPFATLIDELAARTGVDISGA